MKQTYFSFFYMKIYKQTVDRKFLETLEENNIFQSRYEITQNYCYVNRLKLDEIIGFSEDTVIEEFSTFADGSDFFSSGCFSSLASSLPLGSKTGRYTSLANGLKKIGFRHPIDSVGMNSAFFNFKRENVYAYFKKYESNNNIAISKEAVPIPQPQRRPISVGNDVWIGSNVTINGGVKIGNGAVIASNSVVTKDVEPYSIVSGIPAVHRKWRFNKDICNELIRIKWWDYELGDMYNEGIDFSNPDRFINNFKIHEKKIRKISIRKFSPYLYYYFNNEIPDSENYIIDAHNNYMCFDKKKLEISKSKFNSDLTKLKLIVRNDKKILAIDSYNYINIKENLSFSVTKNINDIDYKIYNEDENSLYIKVNNKYLSSTKNNFFDLKEKKDRWEIFSLSKKIINYLE